MSGTPNDQMRGQLIRLISSLDLMDIQIVRIESEKSSFGAPANLSDGDVEITWRQIFPQDDPLYLEENIIAFRPKYDVAIKKEEKIIFKASLVFALLFMITDKESFDLSWAEENAQRVFRDKQVQKTLWPVLRQHIIDLMSRHGLRPISLPWIK